MLITNLESGIAMVPALDGSLVPHCMVCAFNLLLSLPPGTPANTINEAMNAHVKGIQHMRVISKINNQHSSIAKKIKT